MIYPDKDSKEMWDLFMTVILLISCIITPYQIAFIDVEDIPTKVVSAIIDVLFLLDMIVIFNTAI